MNVYDSARIADVLAVEGYKPTQHAKDADLVILNTCHIREKAVNKVYSELGRLKSIKKPEALIAVGGCVAQAEGIEISHRAPAVDFVFGPQNYHKLPSMLTRAIAQIGKKNKHQRIIETNFPAESKFEFLPNVTTSSSSAFLTIQEGCDKFCNFCVVPYTRGPEYSRPLKQIVNEAVNLVSNGAKEIILLGQNVNAYNYNKKYRLSSLIRALSNIKNLKRIRFTTSHPKDMTEDLIDCYRDCEKLMPFLHLPIQSGSNKILKLMNRKHDREYYISIIEKLKKINKDIKISSDFIVGYPGETEEDFQDTMELLKKIGFISSYSFIFSPRPGTPAAAKELNNLSTSEIRLKKLQNTLENYQRKNNKKYLHQNCEVLIENKLGNQEKYFGRTKYMTPVIFEADSCKIGELANVTITSFNQKNLFGIYKTNKIEAA